MKKSFWFLIIITLLIVIFSVQNAEQVPIKFAVWQGQISLAILLILTFLLGLIFGAVYSYFGLRKKKTGRDIGDVAFENDKQESEVETEEVDEER